MSGGCGSRRETMAVRTVYAMRHGQKGFGSDDPSLTERGREQVAEAVKKYLTGVNFKIIYHGTHFRHQESTEIAKEALEISSDTFQTPLLSLTDSMNDAANQCAMAGLKHPDGLAVGFRVDTWIKTNRVLMNDCFEQFYDFLQQIPKKMKNVLAISSSPIIESVTVNPEKTWLLGECGIIKYIIDDEGTIISSETIFEGFFEKPPQKNL